MAIKEKFILKKRVGILPLLVFISVFIVLGGCKGAASTQSPVISVDAEKPQVAAHIRNISPRQNSMAEKQALGAQQGGARQGIALALRNSVSTFAGRTGVPGAADGSAGRARFDAPKGITTDGINLYLADFNNHTIRKIEIANARVTTIAGTAGKKGSNDGKGAVARFNRPFGITTDSGYLYVTDSNNHCVRRIDIESGEVTTIAGKAGEVGYVDGTTSQARFFIPEGITSDGKNLYVSDTHNHSVRKIDLENDIVTTLAGLSGAPGLNDDVGSKARFSNPKGITTDGKNLYVVDFGNNRIRKVVIATGLVTTLAGGDRVAENPSIGQGETARLNYPSGITSDGHNLYVVDTFNRVVRKIVISSGNINTIAGKIDMEGAIDAVGSEARFKEPVGITTDGSSLYVTDSAADTVRKIR
jgi:hypothetical protein